MPLLDQMADAASHPGRIVSEDCVRVEKRRRAVDEHDRGACPALCEQVAVVVTRRLDDQAIHSPGGKRGNQLPLAILVFVRAPGEGQHPALDTYILDRSMKRA